MALTPQSAWVAAQPTALRLLRCFELRRADTPAVVPGNVQRLLAFLALRQGPQHRITVAGTLWMESTDEKAAANLRTAIWRARRIDPELVCSAGAYLQLGDHVQIDFIDIVERARSLVEATDEQSPKVTIGELAGELLPEWYDEWVLLERERLRQIRLHGLEALCRQLARRGRYSMAIDAGLVAVGAEPLRESAHRALIQAHLAEGNLAEAVRQYDSFASLLCENLGVEPSPALRALVAPHR